MGPPIWHSYVTWRYIKNRLDSVPHSTYALDLLFAQYIVQYDVQWLLLCWCCDCSRWHLDGPDVWIIHIHQQTTRYASVTNEGGRDQ